VPPTNVENTLPPGSLALDSLTRMSGANREERVI